MSRPWHVVALAVCLLAAPGCAEDTRFPGIGSRLGGGGTCPYLVPLPACQDPPELASGALGPSLCNCPCSTEAPEMLRLIAQAAVAAYETNGALCPSGSTTVPAFPPPARCYQPDRRENMDFSTWGDWACLGVAAAITSPIHCAYGYNAGSGYLGPALGGPDPGAQGFEVTAQGDWNDDGVFSTFTIAGRVDPERGEFSLSPVFEHQPDE